MSYILDFLEHHLFSFLQSSMEKHKTEQSFFDITSQNNIFSLMADTLLYAAHGCNARQSEGLVKLVRGRLLIAYECLQTSPLVTLPRDSALILLMKEMQ